MTEQYKHVGFKVPAELHYKLKLMSIQKGKSITELLAPTVKKMVDEWEKEKNKNEKNS